MEKYMQLAINLAEKARGFTNPNPLVGAVIVKNGEIIGKGYHEKYGFAHAEVNAIKNSSTSVEDSELYVTLEPCAHFGKTPPCCDAIIKNKIKKVYIGMKDPNPLVLGKGIEKLKNAGIEVVSGVLEEKCRNQNEIYIKFITQKIPFISIKTAMTLDGKTASNIGDSKWITCEKSRRYVHNLRNTYSAILVGINTVIKDNPFLTSRLKNSSSPIRIIVDSHLRLPINSNVLNNLDGFERCIIATLKSSDENKKDILKKTGAEIIETDELDGKVNLLQLFLTLGKMGIDSVLVEGGSEINYSVLENKLADKIYFFISPKIIGGNCSKTPVGGKGIELIKDSVQIINTSLKNFDNDILITGYIKKE